jgi:hypothetical protein
MPMIANMIRNHISAVRDVNTPSVHVCYALANVWISTRGHTRHDIRVKVSCGDKAIPDELIPVALGPELRVTGGGDLSADELALLGRWVELNWKVLLAYWNGELFTEQAIASLKPLQQ